MRGGACATVFVVGPAPFLVAWWCVYAWVVCSAREGGSRPLLLVYLPVMSVLRFRERASVAVAGFGKVGGRVVEPVVALVHSSSCTICTRACLHVWTRGWLVASRGSALVCL